MTHIVTTRSIPTDSDTSPIEIETSSSKATDPQLTHPPTINPSLLDRPSEATSQSISSKVLFDQALNRKSKAPLHGLADAEPKKCIAGNNDILQRAHGMGIKIWQLEKLNRVIGSINGDLADAQGQLNRNARNTTAVGEKISKEDDLSHLLRNEQLNGPSDRDHTEELIPFRGYFLYIYDMDERTKPILVKEYPKVARSEAGEWPQFRANPSGKCPFVEDPHAARQEVERANQRLKEEQIRLRAESRAAPRTRAETASQKGNVEPVAEASQRRPLTESKNAANKSVSTAQQLPSQEFCPPPAPVARANGRSPAGIPKVVPGTEPTRFFGGEPAASGLQQSNITSAIRSQMISSTAAAPGAKAGTSREVHGLKRKVLERNAPSLQGMRAPLQSQTIPAPARAEQAIPVTRQSRRRAQERLVHIEEESTQSEEEVDVWREEAHRASRENKIIKIRDPRPGYCENCREKYEDFDDVSLTQILMTMMLIIALAHCWPQTPQICPHERALERPR